MQCHLFTSLALLFLILLHVSSTVEASNKLKSKSTYELKAENELTFKHDNPKFRKAKKRKTKKKIGKSFFAPKTVLKQNFHRLAQLASPGVAKRMERDLLYKGPVFTKVRSNTQAIQSSLTSSAPHSSEKTDEGSVRTVADPLMDIAKAKVEKTKRDLADALHQLENPSAVVPTPSTVPKATPSETEQQSCGPDLNQRHSVRQQTMAEHVF